MKYRQAHLLVLVLIVVLWIGQTAQAGVLIPSSSRASGVVIGPGLYGFFYDRDDPPFVIASLAVADAIIAGSLPSASFESTLLDYPNGSGDILFLPMLGDLLGMDVASLIPAAAAVSAASPMVTLWTGVIAIKEEFDIDPMNNTIDVRFAFGSDDGTRLRIGGQTLIEYEGIGVFFDYPPQQIGVASFEAPGLYPVEIVWYDHFGGIGIEWYSSIPGGPDSGAPNGTVGIVPSTVLGILEPFVLDIKPGSLPNRLNPASRGVVPVAVLTTDTFDATVIDPLSVTFGSQKAPEAHRRGHVEDVDGDGDLDLLLHFRIDETGIRCGDTSATFEGMTFDGQVIEGTDSIQTVGCR